MDMGEKIGLAENDSLVEMFYTQADFQERLDPHFYSMSTEERVQFIKEHSIHLSQEINEMLYELPFFKPWKDYSSMSKEEQEAALERARMEMIDAWHFFMNMCIALDFTPNDFYNMYLSKMSENHKRQDEGYTYDKSYREATK